MSAQSIGDAAGRVVNELAAKTGRVKQFPDREQEPMNASTAIVEHEPKGAALAVMTPMELLDRAIVGGQGIEVLKGLMDLQERWEKNQARKAFDDAMASAKSEIPVILKNRRVGFDSKKAGSARTDYKHEDLAEIARTVDPILARFGLSYRFRTSSTPNEPITVTCVVSHRAGHSEENTLQGPRDESGNKNSIQSIGSTLTYLQRYSLKAALGLAAATDDDARSAEQSETITADQAADLREGIEEVARLDGAEVAPSIGNFCKFMGIASLFELPAARHEEALAILKQKKAAAK
jgi:hypothetical protein